MRFLAALLLPLAFAAAAATPAPGSAEDPAGDVVRAMVQFGGGGFGAAVEGADGHADIDILGASAAVTDDALVLNLTVAGTIRQEGSYSGTQDDGHVEGIAYMVSLDVRGSDEEDYRVVFTEPGAALTWKEGEDFNGLPVESERDGATLHIEVPLSMLGERERLDWIAAAVEGSGASGGSSFETEQFVDVTGPFPGYEFVWEFDGEDVGFQIPGPGLAAVLLAVAAAWRARAPKP